jgi:uncharacterized surface protein with fasciclin (FAS1) repeats
MTTPTANTPNTRNLLQTAASQGQFGTFAKLVETAGLSETLNAEGPFTVFAPTDAAFAKLPQAKLDSLSRPENKAELVSILKYHVLQGRKSSADIGKLNTASTVSGASAPITMTAGKVSIDGAQVIAADIASSNGVIHGIDKVNLPKVH